MDKDRIFISFKSPLKVCVFVFLSSVAGNDYFHVYVVLSLPHHTS